MDDNTGLNVHLLSGGYGTRTVIEGITCHVSEGQIALLVGRNGSGKSTLLRAIMGLLPVCTGDVFWRGTKLPSLPYKMRQNGIVYIPQRKALFSTLSILTNLELGCAQRARIDRRRLIDSTLKGFSSLNGNVKRIAAFLSGGERRLLSFACGAVAPPTLLLADEPLAGLAPKARAAMLRHLKQAVAGSGVTIIMVEHDVRRATQIADRVIGLREGRIVVDCPSFEFDEYIQKEVFLS